MKVESFLANFELLTDAPNTVVKLREIILQLAVRGKLVAQDSSDESAKILIEKVRRDKKLLVKQKKIPKARALEEEIDIDNAPYSLPESWLWVSLAEIGHDWGQKKPDIEFTLKGFTDCCYPFRAKFRRL